MSQPSFLQNLAQTLRQPTWIGTLASVGVHGLLWVILPVLPISSNTPEQERRTVQLVELTPEELSRVPQFTQPQNLFPNNPIQGNILPSSPLTQPSTLPPPIDPSLLYPLPINPPPNIWSPLPNTFENNQPDQPEPKKKPVTRNNKPERTDDDSKKPDDKPKDDKVARNPDPKPSETTEPESGKTTQPEAPVLPEKLSPEKIAQLRQEAQKQVQEKLGPDATNTTEKEYYSNLETFTSQAKQLAEKSPTEQEIKDITVTNIYPEDACLFRQLKAAAQIGAVFKPNGEIDGEPTVLLSSGYKLLNNAAIAHVQETKLDASDQYRVRRFIFQFQPSDGVCAAAKPPTG